MAPGASPGPALSPFSMPNPQQKGAPPLPMPTLFPLRCIYSTGCAGEWTGKYPTLTPTPDIYMNLGAEAPAS